MSVQSAANANPTYGNSLDANGAHYETPRHNFDGKLKQAGGRRQLTGKPGAEASPAAPALTTAGSVRGRGEDEGHTWLAAHIPHSIQKRAKGNPPGPKPLLWITTTALDQIIARVFGPESGASPGGGEGDPHSMGLDSADLIRVQLGDNEQPSGRNLSWRAYFRQPISYLR
jgi:hypothetical protein